MLAWMRSRVFWGVLLFVALLIGGVLVATVLGARSLAPLRLVPLSSWGLLAKEAEVMEECIECHEPADMHTCATCHDEHGDAMMAEVPFNVLILLTGDVPEPDYIPINDILPYAQKARTHVALLDFLAAYGVDDFQSVTMLSSDGGFVTIERPYLTPEALLLPHVDGVRFAAENLHISTWLKGITRIVVVGNETPLQIDGVATSMGRLLLGPTRLVTVEQTEVMLESGVDGQIRRGKTAFRLEGAPVEEIVSNPEFRTLVVRDESGQEHSLAAEEVRGAVLALVRGQVTLVLPERSRASWVVGVVAMGGE